MTKILRLRLVFMLFLAVGFRSVYVLPEATARGQWLDDALETSSISATQHLKSRNRSEDKNSLSISKGIARIHLYPAFQRESPYSILSDGFSDETLGSNQGLHDTSSPLSEVSLLHLDTIGLPCKRRAEARSYRKLYDSITDEFQVNTLTDEDQHSPFALSLADNTQIILWSSKYGTDGVYAQIYDENWNSINSQFQINGSAATDSENYVTAALLKSGSFVVAWDGSDSNIYARIFNKDVSQGSEFQVNSSSSTGEFNHVVDLDNGGFVVVWADNDAYARIYDGMGNAIGSEFVISTYTDGNQYFARVANLHNGTFVVTWSGEGQEDSSGVYAQIFQNNGNKVGSQFLVNTYTSGDQQYPYIANLKDGRFVITWRSYSQPGDGSGLGVFSQIFDSSGNKIGSEFQSNQYVSVHQVPRDVIGLYDGGILITWTEEGGKDGSGYGIYGRRHDQDGNPSGDEFQINVHTSGTQAKSVSAATKCGFVTTWQSDGQDGSGFGIYARAYLDSISPLRLNYPLQNLNAYKSQPFSFVVPVNTFHTTSSDPITYTTHILLDGQYQDIDSMWIDFDVSSRTFTGTPTQEQIYTVQVEAFDGCGYAVSEFQLAVSGNFKPVANAIIPNQAIPFSRDEIWEYYIPKNAFKDLEGDPIVYTSAAIVIEGEEKVLMSVWESLAFNTDDGKLSGTPNLAGEFTIRIYADDGIGDLAPTSIDMTVEIVSQGIEILELYEIMQGGFKGFISSDNSYLWIANESNLRRFEVSSEDPNIVNDLPLEYNFSQTITAIAEVAQERLAVGDNQGNLRLLSSTTVSEISSISLSQEISDLYNDDDTYLYASHANSVSIIDFSSGSLVLSLTNSVSATVTTIAKTTDIIYTGTDQGLYKINTLTNTVEDLNISDLGYLYDLAIHETYMYALKSYGLWIFDISDTTSIIEVSKRPLNELGTSLTVAKVDGDIIVFITEKSKGLSIINVSKPENTVSEGYYESISNVNSAFVSGTGRWAIVLKEFRVYTAEIFRRNIQLQVCDTSSNPCSEILETQAKTDLSKDVKVIEHLPTYKKDFAYFLSYTFALYEVSGENYRSAPDWLSYSQAVEKVFRLSGQAPEYLIGSVVDFEVRAYAFESDGDKLLTIKKVVSLSIVPKHASVVSTIPDQSLQVGEEWIFSFSNSVFSDAGEIECEYQIDSQWIKSYDLSYILFTPSSRQWYIASTDSTKEILFNCDPCEDNNYSKTYVFKLTAKNPNSETDPGVYTKFKLFIYSGRIPDQQIHPGISETIILDESIFPMEVEYTVSLLNDDEDSPNLPWWMSYISNERKILMFPSASEIDKDYDIQVLGENNGVELRSQFRIKVRNNSPIALKELENQRVKLGGALDYSISSDTFSDADGDSLSYRVEWKKKDGTQTTAIPSWIIFTESTRTFYGSPSTQGSYSLIVYANDGLGAESSIEFVIEAYNSSPTKNPESLLENLVIHIGKPLSLALSSDIFIDADGDDLSYSAVQEGRSSLPSWLIFNSVTLTLSGTPSTPDLENTSVSIKLSATDGYASAETTFSLSITNSAPQAGTIENKSVHIGNGFSLTLPSDLFTDADGDSLQYTANQVDSSPLPSWLSFNPNTYQFSGTPAASELQNTASNIKVSVSDGYRSAETSFEIAITNLPPVLSYSVASQISSALQQGSVKFKPGVQFQYIISGNTFTDGDNDHLTFSSRLSNGDPLPQWLSFDPNTQQYYGTPTQTETLGISITASDGYASASDTFDLSVQNKVPRLNSLLQAQFDSVYPGTFSDGSLLSFQFSPNTFVDEDDSLIYSAVFNENGGDWRDLDFSWIELEGRTFSGTVSATSISNSKISLQVTASDGQQSVTDSFSFTILSIFPSPSANTIQIDSVKNSIEVEVSTNGPKIAVFSYGTLFVLDTSNDEKTDWRIEGSPADVNYVLERVKYRPSSNRALSESSVYLKINGIQQEYPISVFEAEKSMTVSKIPNQKAYIESSFSLSITPYFTYSDESQLSYSLSVEDWPKGYSDWLNFDSGLISGFPVDSTNIGDYTLQVTAKDEFDESETQTIRMAVDYTDFQIFVIWVSLIAQYAGPIITGLGIITFRSALWNFFTKSRKKFSPIQFNHGTYETREILILRPDEEEMAEKIYRKLSDKTNLDEGGLVSDLESIMISMKKQSSVKYQRIQTTIYQAPGRADSSFHQSLMNDEAPTVKIHKSHYNTRFIFFYIKDLILKKNLNSKQRKQLNNLIREFKEHMLKKYKAKIDRKYNASIASNWSKCRDTWTLDMPDLTKSLDCECDEMTEFFSNSNSELDFETFANCIKLELWKARAVRVRNKGHIRQFEVYYNKMWCKICCKIPRKRQIPNWMFQKWLTVDISESLLKITIDSSDTIVSELLNVRMFDRKGYLIYKLTIIPKPKILSDNTIDVFEERKYLIKRSTEIDNL